MITVKINKHISIQSYLKNGIKILVNYHKDKKKWFIIKLDKHEKDLLKFIITILTDNE